MSHLIQFIENLINQKTFDYQEDNTSVNGIFKNRSGNRFYVRQGITGIASISILTATDIQISIPYSASYERKKYVGIKNEYRTENQNPYGTYNLKLTLVPFINIEFIGISGFGPCTDPNHDSNVMTVRALDNHVKSPLYNSLKNYPNIENELFEIHQKLTHISNKPNTTASENVTYIIKAGFVQIINGDSITTITMEDFMNKYTTYGQGSPIINVGKMDESNINLEQHFNNLEQKQNLIDAAAEIQQLLTQLDQTYPTNTPLEKQIVVTEVLKQIESNPPLKARVIGALKFGGVEALKELLDHPVVNILLAALQGWQDPE